MGINALRALCRGPSTNPKAQAITHVHDAVGPTQQWRRDLPEAGEPITVRLGRIGMVHKGGINQVYVALDGTDRATTEVGREQDMLITNFQPDALIGPDGLAHRNHKRILIGNIAASQGFQISDLPEEYSPAGMPATFDRVDLVLNSSAVPGPEATWLPDRQ